MIASCNFHRIQIHYDSAIDEGLYPNSYTDVEEMLWCPVSVDLLNREYLLLVERRHTNSFDDKTTETASKSKRRTSQTTARRIESAYSNNFEGSLIPFNDISSMI